MRSQFSPDDDQRDERSAADQSDSSRRRTELRSDGNEAVQTSSLPASLPMVLSGLRIAVNLALLIAIAAEMAGATKDSAR